MYLFFLLFSNTTEAQNRGSLIRGVVENSTGEKLNGVSVVLRNTKTNFTSGTSTDSLGVFTFAGAAAGGPYTFTFTTVGYETENLSGYNLKDGVTLSLAVKLKTLSIAMEQVVVVGYGTQKRKDLTGSVSSLSEKDFADMPVARLDQAIAGRISGLDILSTGGRPGDGASMLLRGKRSFSASNDPLIILDGMPYYGTINDINPYDVKSIDVLKDASSTAIYGSRGANGVIIITSVRGANTTPRFKIESYVGTQMRYGRIPFADGVQYAEWGREAFRSQPGGYPYEGTNAHYDSIIFDAIELKTVMIGGKGFDYQDLLLQSGKQQKHQLSITGGSKEVKYNFSTNYFEQEGIMPDDVFKRMSLRTNLDFTLSKYITAGTSIQFNYTQNSQKSNSSAFQYAIRSNPLGQIYEEDGVTPRFTTTTDGLELNPLADYEFDSYRRDQKGWAAFVNGFAEAKLAKGLTYRLSVGTNFKLRTTKESSGYFSLARNLGLPTASVDNQVDNFKIYESTLTYDKRFGNGHQVTFTGVQGFQSSRTESSSAGVSDLPFEPSRYDNMGSANLVTGVGSNLSTWSLASYAARVFYGYQSKYLVTLSMRADGASQLADKHKWGYFPSAAFAYRISEEKFMESTSKWLSDLKFRISYGVTGNQAISPYQTQGSLARTTYSWNEGAGFGYKPYALANKDLKWESTAVTNFGLDFGILKNRITGNIDIYNTNTYDLLMFRKLPVTSGYDQVLENIGSTNNKGWEISIRTNNIIKDNLKWSTQASVYANHTKITELYNGKIDDVGNKWFIGKPINVYFDYQKTGIWQTSEAAEAASYGRQVGQIKVKDLNKDGKISAEDRMIIGTQEPDFTFNLSNNVTYKAWDLSVLANLRYGGTTYVDAFQPFSKKRYNKIIFDYWTPNNPTNAYPRPNQLYENSGLDGTTLGYRDATLLSIRQVSLGYTIPKKFLETYKISNARVYLSADNLFYWTKSELRDFNMKADWAGDVETYPALRTIIVGINIGF